MTKRGLLIVVSGPSGSGKSTVLQKLLTNMPQLRYSVSATTRSPREGEVDGTHYHFLTRESFDRLLAEDGFLEHASYCGNSYGTPKKQIEQWRVQGLDVLLEIETQGASQVRVSCTDGVFIFILPPSLEELRRRLSGRGTELPEVVEKRLRAATDEIACAGNYDYAVYNDVVEDAVEKIKSIITAEHCRLGSESGKLLVE